MRLFDKIKRRKLKKQLTEKYPEFSSSTINTLVDIIYEVRSRKKKQYYRVPHAA